MICVFTANTVFVFILYLGAVWGSITKTVETLRESKTQVSFHPDVFPAIRCSVMHIDVYFSSLAMRFRLLKHTRLNVVAFLNELPKTQHDIASFVIDVNTCTVSSCQIRPTSCDVLALV